MIIIDFISQLIGYPLGWIMWFAYQISHSYILSMVFFTLIMQIILLPLTLKQKKSMAQTTALQPEQARIRKMYSNNPQKQNEELQKLNEESGINQLAGCLPLLIQLPILYGLLNVIYRPLHYLLRVPETFITGAIEIAGKLDPSLALGSQSKELILLKVIQENPGNFESLGTETVSQIQALNPNIFGVSIGASPVIGQFSMWFPIMAAVLSLAQVFYNQHLSNKASRANNMEPMKMNAIMLLMNPILILWMGFNFPVGLNFYWIIRSAVTILQEFLLDLFIPQSKLVGAARDKMDKNRKKIQEIKKKQNKVISEDGKEISTSSKEYVSKKISESRMIESEKYQSEYTEEELQENIRKLNEARKRDAEKYGEPFIEATEKDFVSAPLSEEKSSSKKKKK